MTITWTNERVKLRDLAPWERNPRKIKNAEAERLLESFNKFGQVQTIAIGPAPENRIYDGHQRKSVIGAATEYGLDYEVDVRRASRELTEREQEQLTVLLHRGAAGEFDWQILADWDYTDLTTWGFTGDELDEHFAVGDGSEAGAGGDTEPEVDKAAELLEKWGATTGSLWQLGAHRLICGDCTDAEVVARVMGGERADCVVTDPPYGVDYDGGTTRREKLEGDDSPNLYYPFLSNCKKFVNDHVALYLWYADGDQAVTQAVAQAGWQVRRNLIWNKNQAQYGALSQQYKQKHEPFLYGHLKGKSPYWAGDNTEVTVWDIDRNATNEHHPTEKPPALFERAILNSSKKSDVVMDGFAGSGTIFIAAENTGRHARGVEISPAYCAVILERFFKHTSIMPERIE